MSSSAQRHALLTRTPLVQPNVADKFINTYRGKTKSPKEQILTLLTLKGNLSPQQLVWYFQLPYDKIVNMLKELDQEKKTYSIPPYNGGQVKRGTKWFLRGRERFNRVLEEVGVELKPEPVHAVFSTSTLNRMIRERKVLPFLLDRHVLKFLRSHPRSTARKILYHFGVRPTRLNTSEVLAALYTLERGNRAYREKFGRHSVTRWSAR
ncbi:MAG: hypothetical protein GH150_04650 [Hadesarchaea archaeon]|nr:hypothetical protein [Hadesarchaea archaeon]